MARGGGHFRMEVTYLVLWVLVLVASILGLVLKDFRLFGITLACALVGLLLMIVHAR